MAASSPAGHNRHYLQVSQDDEPVEAYLGGQDSLVPKGVMLPRTLGPEVLEKAGDFLSC